MNSKIKTFVINGKPGAGKDTFIDLVEEYVRRDIRNKGKVSVVSVSTVDLMKRALVLLGWDGTTKSPQIRRALSNMKDFATQLYDTPYQYVNDVFDKIRLEQEELFRQHGSRGYTTLLFVHSREPEEIERFEKNLNAKSILIVRRGLKEIDGIKNHADENVENHNYNFVVHNDGTLNNLRKLAEQFAEAILQDDKNGGDEECKIDFENWLKPE